MTPLVESSMTRHLLDLVYPFELARHVSDVRCSGIEVTLILRDDSPLSAEVIAAAFRHPDAVEAKASGREVRLTFRTPEAAQSIGLDDYLLELGPFRPGELSDDRLVLYRRDGEPGIKVIEVVDMGSEDVEWRRLMAGEVDLMPMAMVSALAGLAEVPDLRIVPLADPVQVSLIFRVDGGPMQEPILRHAVSLALRRGPMAEVAIGDGSLAASMREDVAAARDLLAGLPARPRLRLIVPAAIEDLQRAALVLEQQLAGVAIELELETVEVDDFSARMARRDFDLAIFYSAFAPRYFGQFIGTPPGNLSGYAGQDFEAAVTGNRTAEATAILQRDLPITPLFFTRDAVVVSRRFCNVKPVVSHDLSWLADVRPCAPGEDE
jgi:hypothetical protein